MKEELNFWDRFKEKGDENLPFLKLSAEEKKDGFEVQFLTNEPRKETENNYKPDLMDFWFDVIYKGEKKTWTLSAETLLAQLKEHLPLVGKIFQIKLQSKDGRNFYKVESAI